MPKIMNQLVVSSTSESTLSTGTVSGGGGGISYDLAVEATGQSTTTTIGSTYYNDLSYSTVSAVQYGTFTQGVNVTAPNYPATATNTVQFEFDTAGIYHVELCYYDQNGAFGYITLTPSGQTSSTETFCYNGNNGSYVYGSSTTIRQFNVGDKLHVFINTGSINLNNFSRFKIVKIG